MNPFKYLYNLQSIMYKHSKFFLKNLFLNLKIPHFYTQEFNNHVSTDKVKWTSRQPKKGRNYLFLKVCLLNAHWIGGIFTSQILQEIHRQKILQVCQVLNCLSTLD